MNFVHFS